jgi:cell wall-associated NlpC family hydrolase
MEIKKCNLEEEKYYRERIVEESKNLLGTPFRHMGVTRHGVDCKGFGYLAYRRAGLDLPQGDGKIYEPNWFFFINRERYLDSLLNFFYFVSSPKIGDILVFKCHGNIVTHGGIFIGDNKFIHARSGRNVQTDTIDHKYWKKVFHGFMRYKGF